MSHMTLSKVNEEGEILELFLFQTPTSLTRQVEPYLEDSGRVFQTYSEWVLQISSKNGEELFPGAKAIAEVHLAKVQQALNEGYEWSLSVG